MKKINSYDFYNLLDHPGKQITIEHIELVLDSPIFITQARFKCSGVIFQNCAFTNNICFNNLYAPEGISFQSCRFTNDLVFEGVKRTSSNTGTQIRDNLVVFNSTIEGALYFTDCIIAGDISILQSEIGKFYIDKLRSSTGHLLCRDSTFSNLVYIQHINLAGYFKLENSTINSQVRISNLESETCDFINSTIKKDTWLVGGKARMGVSFMDGIYYDNFTIEAVKTNIVSEEEDFVPRIVFNGSEFKKSCIINFYDAIKNNGVFPEIYIDSTIFNSALVVNNNSKQLELDKLRKIHIYASKQLKGDLIFNKLEVEEITLTGTNYEASIIFNKIKASRLYLKTFSNYGKLQFIDFSSVENKHSLLYINNSFLGNAQFSNVSFKSFIDIDIENSDLTNISTSCVTWFTEKNIEEKDKRNAPRSFWAKRKTKHKYLHFDLKTSEKRRELYRQLKLALEKQGDKIQSLVFKKYEIKAHYKSLCLSKGSLTDRFILWVGQTNNHGLNWWKPILIYIPFVFLFYTLIIIAADKHLSFFQFNLSSKEMTWSALTTNISILPELLNPTHSIGELLPKTGYESNFGVKFWDFLSKIFLAFFIFQIITAFRKFSK
jgi:hypothetical protein